MSDTVELNINMLPVEMIVSVFKHLSPNELLVCRDVCKRWREIIDSGNQTIFREFCEQSHYYENAKVNIHRLSWMQLCKSLHLWPQLQEARETMRTKSLQSLVKIGPIQILPDGSFGALISGAFSGIYYYDSATLNMIQNKQIVGNFRDYAENDKVIVTATSNNKLRLMCKYKGEMKLKTLRYKNIKLFLISDDKLFYTQAGGAVNFYDITKEKRTYLRVIHGMAIDISYANKKLYVLYGDQYCYYVYIIQEYPSLRRLQDPYNFTVCSCYVINDLFVYRMLNSLNCAWEMNFNLPDEFKNSYFVRSHGNIVAIGINFYILKLYYVPTTPDFDFNNAVLLKTYDFIALSAYFEETVKASFYYYCTDLQVMEIENGHRIILSFFNTFISFDYIHDGEYMGVEL